MINTPFSVIFWKNWKRLSLGYTEFRDISSFLDFAHFLLLRQGTEKPGLYKYENGVSIIVSIPQYFGGKIQLY